MKTIINERSLLMMKTHVFMLLLLILSGYSHLAAQTKLPESQRGSSDLYIYKASVDDLQQLYLKDKNPDEKMLQSFVTSFAGNEPVPPLPRGNYFIVGANGNQLKFSEHTVDDIYFKIIPGAQFRLCLYDSSGHIIRNAKVKNGLSRLKFDPSTDVYTAKEIKDEQVLEVNNNGVFHYITVEKGYYHPQFNLYRKSLSTIRHTWYRMNNLFHPDTWAVRDKYTGFIVFSKPKYKPGETVKWKAHMTYMNGKPYNKPLDVRLYRHYPMIDTMLIQSLSPYRPGMYQHEFKLTDSLNLALDNYYSITLKTKNKKDNKFSNRFRYEEYELKSVRLSVETKKTEYTANDSVNIKIKITDENEMALYGGRTEIRVTPTTGTLADKQNMRSGTLADKPGALADRQNRKPDIFFGIQDMYKEGSAFIPDVLWEETFDMNDVAEKEITIPDSIFPSGVSFYYDVRCTYLSADNEKKEQSKRLFRNADDFLIDFSIDKGILTIQELHKGKSQQTTAIITVLGEHGETIWERTETLPCSLATSWFASVVKVKTNHSQGDYSISDVEEEQLGADFYRMNDSVFLKVDNPAEIPFWYALRKKDKVIAEGYANTRLDYAVKDDGQEGYGMQLSYLFGKERKIEKQLPFMRKNMSIDVSTPAVVYPGQKTNVSVSVTDKKGRPVENADVTAYAFTSKFANYSMPSIAVKGKARYSKQFKGAPYILDEEGLVNQSSGLTWNRWKQTMSLDTIEYYKFLYPDIFYIYEEPSADNTTQIAPYVVIDGVLQGVHLLWIDDRLHYAKQAQQLDTYLFRVTPGVHNLRFRTHNREITAYNIAIKEGMKTILSFDAGIPYFRGHMNNGDSNHLFALKSKPLKKKEQRMLSKKEVDYLSKQLITIDNNFGRVELPSFKNKYHDLPACIHSENNYYYLNPIERTTYSSTLSAWVNHPILAGPFPYLRTMNGLSNMATVTVNRKPLTNIQIEGGYHYTVYENFQKMKSWEKSPVLTTVRPFVPQTDFNARLLNEDDIHNHFNNKIISNLSTCDGNIDNKLSGDNNTCRMTLFPGFNQDGSTSHPALIFMIPQNNRNDYALFGGATRNFNNLPEGDITIHLVFSDKTSFSKTVTLYPDGQNYLKLDTIGRDEDNQPAVTAFDLFQRYLKIVTPNNPYDYRIVLQEDEQHLEEVIVIGYGTAKKSINLRRNSAEIDFELDSPDAHLLQGRVAGLQVRGISSEPSAPPLIIVNGLPYDGALEDIDPSNIISTNVLKDQNAVSVYGSGAANGVIMIQTNTLKSKQDNGAEASESGYGMRRNFHDDAFWQPALKTNEKGEVSFEVTYPDDITNWNACFIAIGNRKQADKKQLDIRSFKALTARLSVPRFAIRRDSLNAIGRIANHSNDTIEVRQIITFADNRQENDIRLSTSHIEQIPLTVTSGDSLILAYSFSQPNGYFDGEERAIPIFEQGLLQSFGSFSIVNDTTTSTFDVNPDLGVVTIHAEASSLELFRREINRIDRYPYYCNEQMASKIKMLLSKKNISALLGEPFREDTKIKSLITRLNNNRNEDGMWGWWNKSSASGWITKHVINTLIDAEKAGYKTDIHTKKLFSALERELKEGLASIPLLAPFDTAVVKQELLDRLILLKKLNAPVDCRVYLEQINQQLKSVTLRNKLSEMELFALLGMNNQINKDTLMHYSRTTMLGSMYWATVKENNNAITFLSPFTDNIENTLIAYTVLKQLGGHEKELEKIRNYFFECRHDASWQNTCQTSRIIETIMPDMLNRETTCSEVTMYINDKRVTTFPFTEKTDPKQPVRIKKEGVLPLFITVYQQAWNPSPEPESSKGFTVRTHFTENKDTVSVLKAGKVACLEVVVTTDADADYVQIEVPIPAGCTYESKPASWYGGKEAHREYFKEKVSIFCNRLTKGEHRFTIELLPRFTGQYTLNPAKAELMYFPVFYGNEQLKTTVINE